MDDLNEKYQKAKSLYLEKRYEDALVLYQEIQERAHPHSQVLFEYALCCHALARNDLAKSILKNIIQCDPGYYLAYYNLAVMVQDEDLEEAIRLYERELLLRQEQSLSLINLSHLYQKKNECNKAVQLLEKYYPQRSDDQNLKINLAQVYLELKEFRKSYPLLIDLLKIQNIDRNALLYNLAVCQKNLFLIDEALDSLMKINDSRGLNDQERTLLALVYFDKKEYQKSLDLFENLAGKIQSQEYYHGYAMTLLQESKFDKAHKVIQEALDYFPEDPKFHILQGLKLPRTYTHQGQLENIREEYAKNLDHLVHSWSLINPDPKIWLEVLDRRSNFLLAYQGKEDCCLQKQYGEWHSQLVDFVEGKTPEMSRVRVSSKIKIAYISSFFCHHSIAKTTSGFIKYANKNEFEVFVYYLGFIEDEWMNKIASYADHFIKLPKDLKIIRDRVFNDKIDVLFIADIGMDPITNAMAARRLAPIQITTQGHPVTTGYPHVDYFISSKLMEPDNYQDHYSENVILISSQAMAYPKIQIDSAKKNRNHFSLPKDLFLFLSSQSLIKYTPQYDETYVEILARTKNSALVFIEASSRGETEVFITRMKQCYVKKGVDFDQRFFMLPRMNENDFHALHQNCDVFLDGLAWSANNSLLEAWANSDIPALILPGMTMRERHTLAHLTMLSLEQCVAKNEHELVELAVKLKNNESFRAKIRSTISKNKSILYDDQKAVSEFEQEIIKLLN